MHRLRTCTRTSTFYLPSRWTKNTKPTSGVIFVIVKMPLFLLLSKSMGPSRARWEPLLVASILFSRYWIKERKQTNKQLAQERERTLLLRFCCLELRSSMLINIYTKINTKNWIRSDCLPYSSSLENDMLSANVSMYDVDGIDSEEYAQTSVERFHCTAHRASD